ncbi:MAG: CPBP family intramembrane metalloprotease [Alistipes sp.]|nr:CPBP family intramembrane metalloprotease [Alistipes sp.]
MPTAGKQPLSEPGAVPVRRPFPTAGDLFAMLGIVLGMQIVAGLVLSVVLTLKGWSPLTERQQGIVTAISYVSAMLPAYLLVLWYRRARGGRGSVGHFSARGLNPVLLSWGFLFVMATGVVCEPLLALLPAPPDIPYGRGVWAALTLIVAAPVLEELLCRGVVLEALRSRFGMVAAWLVSSLFFGVMHVHPMLVVNALIIGLILGYIYIASGSLWASMALHAFNNAVAYLMLISGREGLLLSEMIDDPRLYRIIYIGALFVTCFSAWMVWRKLRRLKSESENEVAE